MTRPAVVTLRAGWEDTVSGHASLEKILGGFVYRMQLEAACNSAAATRWL